MTKHSTHKRFKGHCGCCGHYRGNGKRSLSPTLMRQLGKVRRFTKNNLEGV